MADQPAWQLTGGQGAAAGGAAISTDGMRFMTTGAGGVAFCAGEYPEAESIHLTRFLLSIPITVSWARFVIDTFPTAADSYEIGIYDGVTFDLLTSGSGTFPTAGQTNQQISIQQITLQPAHLYYAAFWYGTIGGTSGAELWMLSAYNYGVPLLLTTGFTPGTDACFAVVYSVAGGLPATILNNVTTYAALKGPLLAFGN